MCLRMDDVTPEACRLESKQDKRIEEVGTADKVRFVGLVRGILKSNRLVFDEDYIRAYHEICQLLPSPY